MSGEIWFLQFNGIGACLQTLVNLPYALPDNVYQKISRSLLSTLLQIVNFTIKYLPPAPFVVNADCNLTFGTTGEFVTNGSTFSALLTASAAYIESCPPAAYVIQKDSAIQMIRDLWQNRIIYEAMVTRMNKAWLAPKLISVCTKR